MHKSEHVLENEVDNILRNIQLQTNLLILTRKTDIVSMKRKKGENLLSCGFSRSGRPQSENQRKQKKVFYNTWILPES